MDSEALLKFLKDNNADSELVSFAESLNRLTPDTVRDFLDNSDEGKKLFLSLSDARVTKGIESFKSNNLSRLIEDEISKRYPAETEDQKKLRELEKRQNDLLAELKRKDLVNFAFKEATARNLPLSIIDRLVADDEDSTRDNLTLLESAFSTAVEAAVADRFKAGGRSPVPNGTDTTPPPAQDPDDLITNLLNLV